jgi:hypothetical protein
LTRPATTHAREVDQALLAAAHETRREQRDQHGRSGAQIASLLAELREQAKSVRSLQAEVERLRLELHRTHQADGTDLDAITADKST